MQDGSGIKESTVSFRVLKKNFLVQCIRGRELWASQDNWVFHSVDAGESWRKLCKLHPKNVSWFGRAKDFVLRSYPIRRWRNTTSISHVQVLNSGTLILIADRIYRFTGQGAWADPVFDFEREGIHPPLTCGLGYCEEEDVVAFGEYQNRRPHSVAIITGRQDGTRWEIAYRFVTGAAKHTHSLTWDPFRKGFWIATGDDDQESGLHFTGDFFKTLQTLGSGDQGWRMVGLLVLPDYLIWGSDAGKDAPRDFLNHIYRWDFASGSRIRLAPLDNPAYFASRLTGGGMVLVTTFEPEPALARPQEAALWHSRDGKTWKKILAFPHLAVKRTYGSRYAMLNLPAGIQPEDAVFCTPMNVVGQDFRLLKVSLP